jgi:bacterioferritin-associated ferredoxin
MDEELLVICRCEEATESEILEAIAAGARSLNDIKRMTRAGMGLCQGRTCRRLLSELLRRHGEAIHDSYPIPPTVRPPVRPLTLGELAEEEGCP